MQKSVDDLRESVARTLPVEGDVLLNLIEALMVGPRPESAVEATLSPAWGYHYSNLYAAIYRAGKELAPLDIEQEDWLQKLREARLEWLATQKVEPQPATGKWGVRIMDASDYPRPKTETVQLGYVHSAEGMRLGHGLSLLCQDTGEGSWVLPSEIAWIPPGVHPATYGVVQIEQFVKRYGWPCDQILDVDAGYTVEPFLRPVHEAGVPILGRVAAHRCFFLPPPPYRGVGRPPVRGRKIKLNDGRTLPPIDQREERQLPGGGRIEVSRWNDLRMRKWPTQRLLLYRVIEYRPDGKPRYKRPLWLIFVPAPGQLEAPTPLEAQAIYERRFGVEHHIRFLKQELGLTAGQFNSLDAEARVQVWVEMVALAFWFLWALSRLAKDADRKSIPGWWRDGKLTPGVVRRLAPGLLLSLGWKKPQPKLRGKSPGRSKGTELDARERFKPLRRAV